MGACDSKPVQKAKRYSTTKSYFHSISIDTTIYNTPSPSTAEKPQDYLKALKYDVLKHNSRKKQVTEQLKDKTSPTAFQRTYTVHKKKKVEKLNLLMSPKITNDDLKIISNTLYKDFNHLKHFQVLFFHCDDITDVGMQAFCKTLKTKVNNLSHLGLKISACKNLSNGTVIGYKEALFRKHLMIEKMELDFPHCHNNVGLNLVNVAFLKKYHNLKQLKVSLKGCYRLTEITVKGFHRALSNKLHNLEALDLDLNNCYQINQDGMKLISQGLKAGARKLKSLKIDISWCNFDDTVMESISDTLSQGMPKLEDLWLNCNNTQGLSNASVWGLSEALSKRPKKLNNLKLNFSSCPGMGENALGSMCRELNTQSTIENLKLSFSNINNSDLKALGHVLHTGLHNLKDLLLEFNKSDNFTESGMLSLVKGLSERPYQIYKLHLVFNYCQNLKVESIKVLSNALQNNESLKRLDLCFKGCDKLTDECMKFLNKGISMGVPQLENLHLTLNSCSKITDLAMKDVADILESKAFTLTKLKLNISDLAGVTDPGLVSISKGLSGYFAELKRFDLQIRVPNGMISDVGLNALSLALTHRMSVIKNLELSFNGCHYITDKGLVNLSDVIHHADNEVLNLRLSMNQCGGIDEHGMKGARRLSERGTKRLMDENRDYEFAGWS